MLLALLPAAALALFFAILASRYARREALIRAAVIWGTLLVAITELLSLGGKIEIHWLSASWLIVIVAVGFYASKHGAFNRSVLRVSARPPLPVLVILIPIAIIAITTFAIALIAPPNTSDSHIYHMARVAHWAFNQSVAHYATDIQQQILLGPWAEYGILHLQILSGNTDRFANLMQWSAFIGSLVSVSLITQRLGGGLVAQCFSALLVSTTPMVILQASSTQNDLVLGFWISCIGLFMISYSRGDRSWVDLGFIGMALGIAILTKPTAYFFAFPFFVWGAIGRLRIVGFKTVALESIVIVVIALILSLGMFSRNIQEFGGPLGPTHVSNRMTNELHGPGDVVSAIVKNVFIHWDSPFEVLDEVSDEAGRSFHEWMGVFRTEARLTMSTKTKYRYPLDRPNHEDFAPNFRNLLLLLVVIPLLFSSSVEREVKLFALCSIMGFMLFSVVIKWQVFASRLHTPFFILIAPFCALVATHFLASQRRVATLAVIFGLLSADCVFANATRPIIEIPDFTSRSILSTPRNEQLLPEKPVLYENYLAAIRRIGKGSCRSVGLLAIDYSFEYPLWRLADSEGLEIDFHHVLLMKGRRREATSKDLPCMILSFPGTHRRMRDHPEYESIWQGGEVRLFAPVRKS